MNSRQSYWSEEPPGKWTVEKTAVYSQIPAPEDHRAGFPLPQVFLLSSQQTLICGRIWLWLQSDAEAREEITSLFANHVDGIKKIYMKTIFTMGSGQPAYKGFTFQVQRIKVGKWRK